MHDSLSERGRSMEEVFFKQKDAQLIAQRKKLEEMKKNRESLAQISGIRNEKVLDKLVELDVSPTILATLTVLPLVEVAWADGTLSDQEREAVLAEVAKGGSAVGSVDHELLSFWLKERPSSKFLEAWIHFIVGLSETMSADELKGLKTELLRRARRVAEASGGGYLGLIRVSAEEKAVLKKMEDAFEKKV